MSEPQPRLIDYAFPLRPDSNRPMAVLSLPPDLTEEEAQRLARFIEALVIERGDDE